jgi:hypothetical protein
MPTPTYTALANITLGSSASSVTFSSIPATYRDLVLIQSGTSTNTSINSLQVRLNGDSGSNYPQVFMSGESNDTTSSASFTDTGLICGYAISSGVVTNVAQIMDYSATDKHKTALSRHNSLPENRVRAIAGRWANTAAVTSLLCRIDSGASFNSGTTFALYGILS